ncbi:MAG: tRNA (adenosine(37)-N6)-threonylcarbamoyltransferase complex dimerization subunit type 1 TsaB [Methylococcaceae bacterium]|nr:tRNA (adenosine(37)-N6)-threonylcarbamoyltransferase complex dimerization subunit type 1 TsaB [Methylococcaceae bacterium]
MKLLAVETSTEACSVALFIDGEVAERYQLAPKTHTKLILPMLDELMASAELKPQQLDALAFSRGPGSFTGVRIATGVIQGIAFGADLPVVPVSTLAALAQDFFRRNSINIVYTAMDARISEIFWGVYQRNADGFATLIGDEAVLPPIEVTAPALAGAGIGSGWAVYQAELMARLQAQVLHVESDCLPRASAIARLGAYGFGLGQAVSVEQAMPVYLRDKVAKTEAERHAAKAG